MTDVTVPASSGVPAPPSAERVRVCPWAAFRWRNGQLVFDDPIARRQLALTVAAERLLRVFADGAPLDAAGDRRELAQRLLAAGVLVPDDGADLGVWATLGPAALAYHLGTRTGAATAFASREEDGTALVGRAAEQPAPYKDCDGAQVALPDDDPLPADLRRRLSERRSTRAFDRTAPVPADRLSSLLRWTAGVRHRVELTHLGTTLLKTSPSGGARHPIEVYPVIRRVDGLPSGVYHYSVRRHDLERLGEAPTDEVVLRWCGDQEQAADAAVLLVYTAMLERNVWKYPNARSYRAPLIDLGHLSQTVYLVAAGLELGAFFTAATRDEPVEEALGIDWRSEILLGVTGIGIPTAAERDRQRAMLSGGTAAFSFPDPT
jgi:SagB-type dehydrogenase family enzyme